jgi:hypothetical protein
MTKMKMNKEITDKKLKWWQSSWLTMFGLLCISFTLVSLWNQGVFYYESLGFALAVLISLSLEASRLTCLHSMFVDSSPIAILIYILIASWCLSANVIAFSVKFESKRLSNLTEFDKLFNQVVNKKKLKIDFDILNAKNEIHQNEGLSKKYPQNKEYNGYTEDWKSRIREHIKEKIKITSFRPLNKAQFTRSILLHGDPEDIKTLNDIRYRAKENNALTGFLRIPAELMEFIIQICLAILIEIMILRFGYLAKFPLSKSCQKKSKKKTKSQDLSKIELSDNQKLWTRQFFDKSIQIDRDKSGWLNSGALRPSPERDELVKLKKACKNKKYLAACLAAAGINQEVK